MKPDRLVLAVPLAVAVLHRIGLRGDAGAFGETRLQDSSALHEKTEASERIVGTTRHDSFLLDSVLLGGLRSTPELRNTEYGTYSVKRKKSLKSIFREISKQGW